MKSILMTKAQRIALDKKRENLKQAIQSGVTREIDRANREIKYFINHLRTQ